MKHFALLVVALFVGSSLLLWGCGGTDDVEQVSNIAFTPVPTATPVPKLCGNGVVDTVYEQCDTTAPGSSCPAGKSCVCCACLAPDETLGEREFTVARPPSKFLSSALGGADVSLQGVPWFLQPLRLVAGRPDPDAPAGQEPEAACSAPLVLAQDAIIGLAALDGSTACIKLFAEDSGGNLDCDGGSKQDVVVTQNSNGGDNEDPPVVETYVGTPGGPGSATLILARVVSINLPVGTQPPNCELIDYDNPLSIPGVEEKDVIDAGFAFTTNLGTGFVANPVQGGATVTLSVSADETFSCKDWTQTDARGKLLLPIPGLDTVIGDTVNMLLLTDK